MTYHELAPGERHYFTAQLRQARSLLLDDAENFLDVFVVMERLAARLSRSDVKPAHVPFSKNVCALASFTHGHAQVIFGTMGQGSTHEVLFNRIAKWRNEAVHTGSFARGLAEACFQASVLIEEVLMCTAELVEDFMVADVITAEVWHPLAYSRQAMLRHSFSWLPVRVEAGGHNEWKLISDSAILSIPQFSENKPRKNILATPIEKLVFDKKLTLHVVCVVDPKTPIKAARKHFFTNHCPLLVTDTGTRSGRLLGIVTAFDLL